MRKFTILDVVFVISLAVTVVGCGVNAQPTTALPTSTSASSPAAAPTLVNAAATPSETATPSPTLKTETLHITGAVAIDDLEPILEDIQHLSGVENAQGGGQDIEVTFNSAQVSREQIINVIQDHGYHVEEP